MVPVTDEVEHSYGWMRSEQADLWLGFGEHQVTEDAGWRRTRY
jgi:ArsR family transcriptional regulator